MSVMAGECSDNIGALEALLFCQYLLIALRLKILPSRDILVQ